ncbi:MAG: glycine zipper 2TM domain-containing protein [Pseudomonadota bacterium]|nr:glycine zipper 2TM domain-containing protein [Pseudomonadota bacterium]
MKFIQQCVISTAALLPLAPLALLSAPAQAQQSNYNAPHIDGFNVEEVASLTPGTDLVFTLYGTPNGRATLHIRGARRVLTLAEVEPGQYEGTYTISSRDALTAKSAVTANLRVGNHVASSVLAESLQTAAGQRSNPAPTATAPKIDRFDVQPVADLSGGNELRFTLMGTPGGKADMTIAGTTGRFFLPEVHSGEYSGVYTIKRRDRVMADSAVTANLRVGDTITSTTLGKTLLAANAVNAVTRAPAARVCNNCATVESVNPIEVKGDGGYLGTIGGGVVGALLGSQVGGGRGKTAAEIAGALGGAYAGRAIEGNVNKTVHYETVVRLQNGATQTITTPANPGLSVGEKIRVTDGQMTRDQ